MFLIRHKIRIEKRDVFFRKRSIFFSIHSWFFAICVFCYVSLMKKIDDDRQMIYEVFCFCFHVWFICRFFSFLFLVFSLEFFFSVIFKWQCRNQNHFEHQCNFIYWHILLKTLAVEQQKVFLTSSKHWISIKWHIFFARIWKSRFKFHWSFCQRIFYNW